MTDGVLIAIISGITSTVAVLVTATMTIVNRQSINQQKAAITHLTVQVDGQLTEIKGEIRASAYYRALAEEREASAVRSAEVALAAAQVAAALAAREKIAAEARVPEGNVPSGVVEQAVEVETIRIEQAARIADATELVASETKRLADAAEATATEPKPPS